MRINNLRIKNFKNIKDADISCRDKRIIVFDGDNGQGKSAILEALSYMLTNILNERIEEYVRWGTKNFDIDSEFSHQNVIYNLHIEGEKGAKKVLQVNNDFFKNSDASKELAKIINPVITKYSAISFQGESTAMLTDSPTERLRKLKEILGIDFIIDVCEQIKEEGKSLKNQVDLIFNETTILKSKKFLYLDVPVLPDIEDHRIKFKELEEKRLKFNMAQERYNEYLEAQYSYDRAKKEEKELEVRFKECMDELNSLRLKRLPKFDSEEMSRVTRDIITVQKALTEWQSQNKLNEELHTRIARMQDQLDDINKKLQDMWIVEIQPFDSTLTSELNSRLIDLEVKLGAVKAKLDLGEKGICPTCHQQYNFKTSLLESEKLSIEKDISNKVRLLEEQNRLYEKHCREVAEYKAKVIEQQNLKDKRDTLYFEIKEAEKIIVIPINRNFQEELKVLNDRYSELEEINKQVREITNFNIEIEKKQIDARSRLTAIEERKKVYSAMVAPTPVFRPVAFAEDQYERVKEILIIYNQMKAEYDRAVSHNERIKQEESDNILKISENEDKIDALRFQARLYDETRGTLEKGFSSYLIEKGATFMKHKMNEFFSRTYGRYKISFVQEKNSIDFFYTDGGDRLTPTSMASGFEKQLISIANRVALSSLQNLGILILDEIDSDASAENSLKLYENLLAETQFTQIFCVTHKTETQEYLVNQPSSVLYYLRNGIIA